MEDQKKKYQKFNETQSVQEEIQEELNKFDNQILIIGAGPVGLATALLLSKLNKYQIHVYEGRHDIPNNPQQSYPIGINPRTLNCLETINPALQERAINQSRIIKSWQIYAGSKSIANLISGTVYGTTRGGLNLLLYEEALNHSDKIKIHFCHKLSQLDMNSRQLEFEILDNQNSQKNPKPQIIQVDASKSRIIACDGVYSKVRRSIVDSHTPGFQCDLTVWNSEHRVLFSQPGKKSTQMDADQHYIFSGNYTAVVQVKKSTFERFGLQTDKQIDDDSEFIQCWTLATGATDNAPPEERKLLLSNEATPENVALLRKYLEQKAPLVEGLFSDDELKRYFNRRSFRGALVHCNKVNIGEWILLMGDAAHSVLPPTGEGVNSGLEDAVVIGKLMGLQPEDLKNLQQYNIKDNQLIYDQEDSKIPVGENYFETYNRIRMPDLKGLGQLAAYLNQNIQLGGIQKISRIMTMILTGVLRKTGIVSETYQELTFGTRSSEMKPYQEIVRSWEKQQNIILPLCRMVVYPIGIVSVVLTSPIWIPIQMYKSCKQENKQLPIDYTLQPPIKIE